MPPRNKHHMREKERDREREPELRHSVTVAARRIHQGLRRTAGVFESEEEWCGFRAALDGWASCELSGAGRLVRFYYFARDGRRGVATEAW